MWLRHVTRIEQLLHDSFGVLGAKSAVWTLWYLYLNLYLWFLITKYSIIGVVIGISERWSCYILKQKLSLEVVSSVRSWIWSVIFKCQLHLSKGGFRQIWFRWRKESAMLIINSLNWFGALPWYIWLRRGTPENWGT